MKNLRQKLSFIVLLFGIAVNAQNLTDKEINNRDIIPFALIENPPLAPYCIDKECTSRFIQKQVERKFNTDLISEVGISGKIQVMIEFIIDIEGKPIKITANGGPEIINQNAIDVIADLPKFKPGMKDGKPINVSYVLPVFISN